MGLAAINMKKPEIDFVNFERELEELRLATIEKIGSKDAEYIKNIIKIQRIFELGGRSALMLGALPPFWLMGTAMLSISKILDNMEIGHNVMHGQYDWMNDKEIHSSRFEWDNTCDGDSWKRTHNYEHHTYTNILGKDRDYGYGVLRMEEDDPWEYDDIFNLVKFGLLSALFQWGVGVHEMEFDRIRNKEVSWTEKKPVFDAFMKKAKSQILKDYMFFPSLGIFTGATIPIFTGNLMANLVRNLWSSAVIFCGHFPEGAHTFDEADCENETKGQWYYRQILGSCNFKGSKLMHIMSGHLSCQIEHHLFPNLPSSRYIELSKEVEVICKKYNVPYNSKSFSAQYWSTFKRMARLSLPN